VQCSGQPRPATEPLDMAARESPVAALRFPPSSVAPRTGRADRDYLVTRPKILQISQT